MTGKKGILIVISTIILIIIPRSNPEIKSIFEITRDQDLISYFVG